MKKLLIKISENLSRLKKKYPELAEMIEKRDKKTIKLPRIEVNKILDISSKELIDFIKEFYSINVLLLNKKDLKPKKEKPPKKEFESLPNEIWKEVYGKYKISNFGRIINWKNKILTPKINLSGFYYVSINNKPVLIHTLVAKNFIKQNKNKKYIIHKDGDRSNNKASNLIRVNFNEIRKNFVSGEIYKYSLSGEFLEKFATLKEASIKSGVNRDNLSKKLNSSKGQIIKYKNYLWERK